jgi:predicted phage tail protein
MNNEMRDSNMSETSDLIRVDLPHWANWVDIYIDGKTKTGFIASVQMKRLGAKKNWQRHLGYNYTRMFVQAPRAQVMVEQ